MLTIPDFSEARVLVVGDVMLDRYWHGDTERISPEAPVPVVAVGRIEDRPGGAANVALNISAAGAYVKLLGLTGADASGTYLKKELESAGVSCQFIQLNTHPTITKLRVLSHHQQLLRLDFESPFDPEVAQTLVPKFKGCLRDVDVVIFSDYGKGTLSAIKELIDLCVSAGIPVVIDPKGTDFERYRRATVITPNRHEFEAVVGRCHTDEELVTKGRALIERLDLQALLVTRSEAGMTLILPDSPPRTLPTHAKEVFDVTGAGDTVVAFLGMAMAIGKDWLETMTLSNLAAGIVVGKLGTATVVPDEMKAVVSESADLPRGVVDLDDLSHYLDLLKSRGERIVMTNGCFDLLHAGHIDYLQKARAMGDRLIVAVNSDESVRRIKGSERPINSLKNRMRVLAALNSVDWVFAFEEDTPKNVICRLKPDILVKGGDYSPNEVVGGECVLEHGGEVKTIDFVYQCSTTQIVEKIRHNHLETED